MQLAPFSLAKIKDLFLSLPIHVGATSESNNDSSPTLLAECQSSINILLLSIPP